jgi:hypothetical protein
MDSYREMVLPGLRNAVLQTMAYADVFDYPLTAQEIHRYLTGLSASKEVVERFLQDGSLVHASEGYYTLPGREGLARIRRAREHIAGQMWPQAAGYGRVISHLPFVRMLAVSGSLAMNNVDRDPDIDYFMVTARGRLWMVRAMVLAVVRLAAARGVRLCPNYLVTEDALVFPDQTLYAAHELAQMVPIFGLDVYEQICRLNSWKERFLPNAQGLPPVMDQVTIRTVKPTITPLLERALRTSPAAWFERWEMQRKIRMLSREQGDSPESCFAADYCKGHNLRHGQRAERILRERLEGLHLEALA